MKENEGISQRICIHNSYTDNSMVMATGEGWAWARQRQAKREEMETFVIVSTIKVKKTNKHLVIRL